eukprot:c24364_g2_i3 orf=369-2918(-)
MVTIQERRPFKEEERLGVPSLAAGKAAKSSHKGARKRVKKRGNSVFSRFQTCPPVAVLCFVLSSFFILLIVMVGRRDGLQESRFRAITPLPVPKVMELAQFQGKHREDLFWGTYRPNLYLGIRSRTPKSLLAGLMWLGFNNGVYSLRHTCENSDNLSKYGWLRHDGLAYGRQEIIDQNVSIQTSFVKKRDPSSGYGGDWALRLSVQNTRKEDVGDHGIFSVFFYIADEAGQSMHVWPKGFSPKEKLIVSGANEGIGHWEIHAKGMEGDVSYVGFHTLNMHNLTQLVWQTLQIQAWMNGRMQLPDAFEASPNVMVFQITKKIPFELDFVFLSGVSQDVTEVQRRVDSLSGHGLSRRLEEGESSFEDRFEKVFNLHRKVKMKVLDEKSVEVGKAALSNLLGGIGYFFGQSKIAVPPGLQDRKGQNYWLYWPAALYTAVPSRSTFPRGFLWDEGFHQLIIRRWDQKLSMDILGHWLDLINIDGWIPREQILGAEALSKVPEEFVLQHTSNANPPTLFMVLREFATEMVNLERPYKEEVRLFLERSLPRLEAWFNWFNTTQVGKVRGSYFWHGRDSNNNRELNPKTLSSGLDDYPRASHPSSEERHIDLQSWMAFAASSMALISQLVGAESANYEATARELSNIKLLNKLYYDSDRGHYSDYGNHTEEVRLQWKILEDPQTGHSIRQLVRVVLQQPRLQFIPHFGYISLFPFIMKMIPASSPILGKHLEFIRDEKLLWTEYGLRSLATTSSMYMKFNTEHDPPYWRGPIWINLNFLVLASLHHYSEEPGPHKSNATHLYMQLRENLIRNIVERFYESGYLWEQYDNTAYGKGKGSYPFTGWTSLILLVMAELY